MKAESSSGGRGLHVDGRRFINLLEGHAENPPNAEVAWRTMSPDGRVSRGIPPKSAARSAEVTSLELENLYVAIDGLTKGIRRLESDLHRLSDRLTRLERRSER